MSVSLDMAFKDIASQATDGGCWAVESGRPIFDLVLSVWLCISHLQRAIQPPASSAPPPDDCVLYKQAQTQAACTKVGGGGEAVQVAGLERFVVPGVVGTDAIFMHQPPRANGPAPRARATVLSYTRVPRTAPDVLQCHDDRSMRPTWRNCRTGTVWGFRSGPESTSIFTPAVRTPVRAGPGTRLRTSTLLKTFASWTPKE
ncbi:hypothetical protein BKA56DRAFT_684350 [Ilyonectria sp. MPI-CAGE-AT-0026]|nr:hypothetical protein BKA56DRAFT_684350 [Ilyonectria sp. MPI-CAGE-AT-0026]